MTTRSRLSSRKPLVVASQQNRCDTAIIPVIQQLESRLHFSTGGGWINAGITGNYYPGNYFTSGGAAAFSRGDDRVDFNFGSTGTPGGSTDSGYAALGVTNWSAQWNGTLIPKFTETYTFSVTSEGAAQFFISPAGQALGSAVINDFTEHTTEAVDTFTMSLIAGQQYNAQLNYFTTGTPSEIRLHWSSADTPDEAIEPLSNVGINAQGSYADLFANQFKNSRTFDSGTVDSSGNPTSASSHVYIDNVHQGTNRLEFNGEAAVTLLSGSFVNTNINSGNVGFGYGYNASNNTTSLLLTVPNTQLIAFTFNQAQRTSGTGAAAGLTNLRLMAPSTPGGNTPLPDGTLFIPYNISAYGSYTTERWLTANNDVTQVYWSHRQLPGNVRADFGASEVWEYEIEAANQTGKDLYITIPVLATDDNYFQNTYVNSSTAYIGDKVSEANYVTQLADLMKYGSNAAGVPYTSPTTNPAYPPLNSNLHLYVEWANELFNFGQHGAAANASVIGLNDPSMGAALNYDGNLGSGNSTRWGAVNIVLTSNIFRSVFGSAAMGIQIRPTFEYQYADYNSTASEGLNLINNYYDNGKGTTFVATPHPVNYYLWGAGAATYYSSPDPTGVLTNTSAVTSNPGFDLNSIPGGSTASSGISNWTFTGTAGVYNDGATATSGGTIPGSSISPTTASYGFQFTVGANPVSVTQVGRFFDAGDSGSHQIHIYSATGNDQYVPVYVNANSTRSGGWQTGKIDSFPFGVGNYTNVILSANTTYYVTCDETAGGDKVGAVSTFAPVSGITINGPAIYNGNGNFTFTAAANQGYADAEVIFSKIVGALGLVNDPYNGTQAAYIQGTGSISQTVNFTQTGYNALDFYLAYSQYLNNLNGNNASDAIRIFVDGVECTPTSDDQYTISTGSGGHQYGSYNTNVPGPFRHFGSAPFNITSTGNHTITISGAGSSTQFAFLDAVNLASLNALFNAGMPGNGQANGQPAAAQSSYAAQIDQQAVYAEAFGLKVVAYEGGWSVGGDFGADPLENYGKYVDSRAFTSNNTAINDYYQSGGALQVMGTYGQWLNIAQASSYPLVQSALDYGTASGTSLPPIANNGVQLPAVLQQVNLTWSSYGANANTLDLPIAGAYVEWNTIASQSGSYSVTVTSTGAGGGSLFVDGVSVGTFAASGVYNLTLPLSLGLHAFSVYNTTGSDLSVSSVTVAQSGAPTAPVLRAATMRTSTATVDWGAVANAVSYNIVYGTVAGIFSNSISAGSATTGSLTGLDPTQVYYVAVVAVDSSGRLSLPSNSLRIANRSSNAPFTANLSSLHVGGVAEPYVQNGLDFNSTGNSAGTTLLLQDYNNPSYPGTIEPMLQGEYWGTNLQVTSATSGGTFDLYSLGLANNSGTAGSVVITAYDPSGASFATTFNFTSSAVANLTLDLVRVTKVSFVFYSGANASGSGRDGAIGNLKFDQFAASSTITQVQSFQAVAPVLTNAQDSFEVFFTQPVIASSFNPANLSLLVSSTPTGPWTSVATSGLTLSQEPGNNLEYILRGVAGLAAVPGDYYQLNFDGASVKDNYLNAAVGTFTDQWQLSPTAPPPAPTNLTAVPFISNGSAGVTVSWTGPGSPAANSFNVLRSTDGVNYSNLQSVVTAGTYSDSTVLSGKTYYYEVQSVFSGNASGASYPAFANVPVIFAVPDYSFETPVANHNSSSNQYYNPVFPGWNTSYNGNSVIGVSNPPTYSSGYAFGVTDGYQDFAMPVDSTHPGPMQTSSSLGTVALGTYTLTVDVGADTSGKMLTYELQLLDNNVVVADTGVQSIPNVGGSNELKGQTLVWNNTTNTSGGLYIRLIGGQAAGQQYGGNVVWDNVRLTQIPAAGVLPAWASASAGASYNWNQSAESLIVNSGTVTIVADPAEARFNAGHGDAPVITAIGPGAGVVFDTQPAYAGGDGSLIVHIGGLSLNSGAAANAPSLGAARNASNHMLVAVGKAGATSAPTFSIDAISQLDLNDNDLLIHAGTSSNVAALLTSGNNSGSARWEGNGIVSSNAALGTAWAVGNGQPAASATFDGEVVGIADVEVRFTYYGDATLDGHVDSSDYTKIDSGFLAGLTGWSNGDFNYDGVVNGSDYTLIDNAFNTQGASLADQIATAASAKKSYVFASIPLQATPTSEIAAAAQSVEQLLLAKDVVDQLSAAFDG